MFTPLITHDLDGAALAAPVNAARCNGAVDVHPAYYS